MLSLEAGGSQLRCHFPGGGHSQSNPGGEACMNERRSHLPSLGLLHTMRRKFNVQHTFYSLRHHIKSVHGKGMTCCTIFFRSRSVDSPHPESPLCSQLKGRRVVPSDKAGFEVYPQSCTKGRVKSGEKEATSCAPSTVRLKGPHLANGPDGANV